MNPQEVIPENHPSEPTVAPQEKTIRVVPATLADIPESKDADRTDDDIDLVVFRCRD
ncbi:MAG: hypothetical protein U9R74_03705 [Pseudomonadota bacterium]|nr:hypothetical protein [Pseudomonadota bacterium]